MDRTNLGSANIAGMSKELALTENRYVRGYLSSIAEALGKTDRRPLVDRDTHLLCHLHHLPATEHCHCAETWPSRPSGPHHYALGRLHDWNGLRAQLD